MAGKKATTETTGGTQITVTAPRFQTAVFRIRGTSPYVQNKFSEKAKQQMKGKQEAGQQGKKGRAKDPKDFQACYEAAKYKSADGWFGIPASTFRNAMISACKIVGFAMTRAKLSVFTEADGFDPNDGTPLVRIAKGEPHYAEHCVRNETGVCDIRPRPMWDAGWEADVRVRFDLDQFSLQDVTNLMVRVGMQVGIGEGRPDSKKSAGMGWGMFEVVGK